MSDSATTNAPLVGHGHIVHTEFDSKDAAATCTFLSEVFGWSFENMGNPQTGDYWNFGDAELGIGGAVRQTTEEEGGHAYTAPYVNVADLNATINTAQKAGATIMVPKTPVPGMGWFSWFQAPGGVIVAAWQNDENAPAGEP